MPMRLKKLSALLVAHGISIAPAKRHYMARKQGERGFTIPAHNGMKTEISDVYLRALCKHFGIDPKDLGL